MSRTPTGIFAPSILAISEARRRARSSPRAAIPTRARPSAPLFRSRISWATLVDAIQVPDDSMYRSGTKLMGAGDRADPGRRSDHLLRHWQAGPAGCALGSADPSPASSPDALLRVSPPGDAKRLERPYTRGVRKEGEDP